MDAPVSLVKFNAPKKALVVTAPAVSSAERVVTTAVTVPSSVEGVIAVEDNTNCSTAEGISLYHRRWCLLISRSKDNWK